MCLCNHISTSLCVKTHTMVCEDRYELHLLPSFLILKQYFAFLTSLEIPFPQVGTHKLRLLDNTLFAVMKYLGNGDSFLNCNISGLLLKGEFSLDHIILLLFLCVLA